MPTDLGAVSGRKRKVQAQAQTRHDGVRLDYLCLIVLVLLCADQSFAKATIEWACLF
jgi:hypothetical protein